MGHPDHKGILIMSKGNTGFIGKRPDHRPLTKTPPLQDRVAANLRQQKRMLKKMGLIGDRYPPKWNWSFEEESGIVEAFTKGEAKARIKEILGIPKKKKLPQDVNIERAEVPE